MALDSARFLRAQDPVWSTVVAELRLGRKQTHWMWFVFPQLRGLGKSETSIFFGLRDAAEAADYVAHPILAERLRDACTLTLEHRGTSPEGIFGKTDSLKLRSSMTLFATTGQMGALARDVLNAFFDGARCEKTVKILAAEGDLLPGQ